MSFCKICNNRKNNARFKTFLVCLDLVVERERESQEVERTDVTLKYETMMTCNHTILRMLNHMVVESARARGSWWSVNLLIKWVRMKTFIEKYALKWGYCRHLEDTLLFIKVIKNQADLKITRCFPNSDYGNAKFFFEKPPKNGNQKSIEKSGTNLMTHYSLKKSYCNFENPKISSCEMKI